MASRTPLANTYVVGDSIGVGLKQALGLPGTAKVGVPSSWVLGKIPQAGTLIVSVGSNDGVHDLASMGNFQQNLMGIRGAASGKVIWVVPANNPMAAQAVQAIASEYGDQAVNFTPGKDGIHPQSYGDLAQRVTSVAPQVAVDASTPAKASSGKEIDPTLGPAIVREAARLGVAPTDLATAIGYETVGTYSTDIRGGAGNHYYGLIQFGPGEQKQYGIVPGMSADDQMKAVGNYLQDRGLQPGMGLLDIYSTINAGRPGLYNARDASGLTVAQHVQRMQQEYGPVAQQIVGGAGDYEPGGRTLPTAQAQQIDPAIDVGGEPAWITTASAAPIPAASPSPPDIKAGAYGQDKFAKAVLAGDVPGARQALEDMKSAGMKAVMPAVFGGGGLSIDQVKKDFTDYFTPLQPYLGAALAQFPGMAKVIPAEYRKDALKAQPAVDKTITPISAPSVSYADWNAAPQSNEDISASMFGGNTGFFSAKPAAETRAASVNAWGGGAPADTVPYSPPATPAPVTPYPKAPPSEMGAGQGFGLGTATTPTLTSALAGSGGTFMGGNGMPPPSPDADPVSSAAETIPTIAGHISFEPPATVQPASLTRVLASPTAARNMTKGIAPGLASGAGFGARPPASAGLFGLPSLASVARAASSAGYTTGVGSPGYLSNPTVAQALASGYHAPDFSYNPATGTGSGGSIYAYKPNGQGGGTYVTSNGTVMSY